MYITEFNSYSVKLGYSKPFLHLGVWGWNNVKAVELRSDSRPFYFQSFAYMELLLVAA